MEIKPHERVAGWIRQAKELPNIGTNLSLYLGMVALGRVRKIDGMRDLAPEPWDFFDHNGNVLSSVTAALAVSLKVRLAERRADSVKPVRFRRSKVMGAALASGIAVNALVETRTGLSLPFVACLSDNCISTPDPIDYAYGVAGAGIGGGMALSMMPESSGAKTELSSAQSESVGGPDTT